MLFISVLHRQYIIIFKQCYTFLKISCVLFWFFDEIMVNYLLFLCFVFIEKKKKRKKEIKKFFSAYIVISIAVHHGFGFPPSLNYRFYLHWIQILQETLCSYTYFTLILIVCHSRFASYSLENAQPDTFYVTVTSTDQCLHSNGGIHCQVECISLTDLGTFPLGSWWYVYEKRGENPTLWQDSVCLSQPAPGDWIPRSVRRLGASKVTQGLCLGDKRVWMDRLHSNIC